MKSDVGMAKLEALGPARSAARGVARGRTARNITKGSQRERIIIKRQSSKESGGEGRIAQWGSVFKVDRERED